jgi:hypothetical protein
MAPFFGSFWSTLPWDLVFLGGRKGLELVKKLALQLVVLLVPCIRKFSNGMEWAFRTIYRNLGYARNMNAIQPQPQPEFAPPSSRILTMSSWPFSTASANAV